MENLPTSEGNLPISENSGSLEQPKVLYTSLSPEEKNIFSLKQELQELKELVRKIHLQQLSDELQLPIEVIENSGEVRRLRRTKSGVGAIPILESEIREAQEKTKTAAAAAKYLNVDYNTYRKYAKLFGIWKINEDYKRDPYYTSADKGKYPVSRILAGEFPDYPVYRLKDKLIKGHIKKPECEQCGWKERRITDNKMPLLLNFQDGNYKNHKLENIRLLCYNCTFCSGTGYIRKGKKYHVLDDPDRVQGSDRYIPNRF
jgi:hypothetical protein